MVGFLNSSEGSSTDSNIVQPPKWKLCNERLGLKSTPINHVIYSCIIGRVPNLHKKARYGWVLKLIREVFS